MEIVQYTLPQRQDYIKQLRESGTSLYEFPLFFQGQMRTFPVFSVEIGFPCYRLANGRTRTAQLEIIATDDLPNDFFTKDPDSEPALQKQDEILRQMVREAKLLSTFKKVKQDQPLILDNDGYIVNGNRRVCAMRLLLQQDEETYSHFKHVQVIFLPPCSLRDIKELEGRLQVQPDIKADYSWTAEAMLYRDLREQGWTDQQIADLYQKKISEIRDLIAMLDDAEHYLETRDNIGKYSHVLKKEYAFRQLQKKRQSCGDDEPRKQLLTTVAYLMLDDPDSTEGRLYDSIPDAHKFLDSIATSLRRDFADQIKSENTNTDNFEILGDTTPDDFVGVIGVLNETANVTKAKDVIRDTIEEMRNQERERKDATYCFRQIQLAYTKLQSALSSLDENAETDGIIEVLKNIEDVVIKIEQTVSDIRDSLSNADN